MIWDQPAGINLLERYEKQPMTIVITPILHWCQHVSEADMGVDEKRSRLLFLPVKILRHVLHDTI